MKNRCRNLLCLVQLISLTLPLRAFTALETDICVYGGTSAGVAAAVQAKRMGHDVVLLSFNYHLGGMSSGGLGQTDIGNKAAIGGVSREFYGRIGRHYGTAEAWKFEPHVAEKVFFEMINEAGIPVYFNQRLSKVERIHNRIQSVTMENGRVYRAKMFIDCTYEGDLMAGSGVSYRVGREANSEYNETLNGIRPSTLFHQFNVPVSPYLVPRDPQSGLIPLIQSGGPQEFGAADQRVQAYCFRMCLTQDPKNRLPILPPQDYSPDRYELMARFLGILRALGRNPQLTELMHIQPMPNGKTDINNNGAVSINWIGGSWDYPEADYAARERIWKEHEDYMRGLFHFLATSPRVPDNIQNQMKLWGLCRDEFADTGGWPHQLYIREARRMVSDYVMTEQDCRGDRVAEDGIGLAAYTMDSHNVRRVVRNGWTENEGDVQIGVYKPYPVSYRAIIPARSECVNLSVPVCVSASHIAYGSIRMEPVFMLLAQAAATASAQAIRQDSTLHDVNYSKLKERLLQDGQVLEWNP